MTLVFNIVANWRRDMKKKRNKLFCGCKYAIDHYEDVEWCPYHNDFSQIAAAIGRDVKERLIKFTHSHVEA